MASKKVLSSRSDMKKLAGGAKATATAYRM